MASRFDAFLQFNPYIQEVSPELLMQVGFVRQRSYDEGVQRVQGMVDKIAGLDVIKDTDKQLLQQKLTGMGTELSKLSGEDFSNPLLVGRISNLATGVYNDPGLQNAVLGTAAVRKKQAQIKELREKHPERYNVNNEAYAMMDISQWMADGQAGSRLVDNKSYFDYYDYGKEVREAMKDFKPSRLRTQLPNGEWLVLNEDQSWTEEEVRKYLAATLSDRAKQQMRVESMVRFAGSDDALLSSFATSLKKNKTANQQAIQKIQAQSTVINDPDRQTYYQEQITSLLNDNSDINQHLEKLNQGDLSYFQAHKEAIAEDLFKNAYLTQEAKGYAHPDLTTEYSPNAVWQSRFVQSIENARLNARMQFEADQNALDRAQQKDIKLLELGYKYLDKSGKLKDVQLDQDMVRSQPNVNESDLQVSGRQEFDQRYRQLQQDSNEQFLLLRKKLLTGNTDLKRRYLDFVAKGGKDHTSSDPADIAAMEYIRHQISKPAAQRDAWINDYVEATNQLQVSRAIMDQQKQEIDDQVALQYGTDILKSKQVIAATKPITIPIIKPITANARGGQILKGYEITGQEEITADDILHFMLKTAKNSPKDQAIAGVLGSMHLSGYPNVSNAKKQLQGYIEKLEEKIGGRRQIARLKNALTYENELYDQSVVNLGDWWTPVATKDPRVNAAVNYVQRQIGGTPDEFSVSRVNKTTGEIQVKLNPVKNTTINTDLMESLGYRYDPTNDVYTITGLPYFKRDVAGLSATEATLASALEGNVNIPQVGYYTPAHVYDPNGNGQFIQIVKDMGPGGQFRYFLKHENSGVILDSPGMDMVDPISAIKAAKALTADKQTLQDIIRKKQPNYIVK